MKAMRLLAAVTFFTLAMSLNSFGYSVLCQSLPKTITVTDADTLLFACAIPANAVATGKSIRVTAYLHQVPLNDVQLVSDVYLNGTSVGLVDETYYNAEQSWNFTITNTGGTGFSIGGVSTSNNTVFSTFGPQSLITTPSLPWSTGWTLDIQVAYNKIGGQTTATGDTFIVEILN